MVRDFWNWTVLLEKSDFNGKILNAARISQFFSSKWICHVNTMLYSESAQKTESDHVKFYSFWSLIFFSKFFRKRGLRTSLKNKNQLNLQVYTLFDSVFCADSEYSIVFTWQIDFEIKNWKIRTAFRILPLKSGFSSNTVQFRKSGTILLIYSARLVEWHNIQSSSSYNKKLDSFLRKFPSFFQMDFFH